MVTASSTIAVRTCGGETAWSTPHCGVNSHSFRGWFTRARTRGTANSCFARSDVTRLSSSSPVAATTTSASDRRAPFEHPRLAGVAEHHLHGGDLVEELVHGGPVLFDQRDVVLAFGEVLREVAPDRAAAGDDDPHQCCSAGASSCASSRSMPSLAMITIR